MFDLSCEWYCAFASGGCVDEYAISVRPVGAQMSALATAQQQTTPDYEYTVQNLQNGQEYEFTVTAISNKYSNQAQSASVKATPTSGTVNQLCSIYIYPTSPTNLRVENQTANSTTLCWDPVRTIALIPSSPSICNTDLVCSFGAIWMMLCSGC